MPRVIIYESVQLALFVIADTRRSRVNEDSRERELLPAASGTNTEKRAAPTVGGDEEPVWSWEQPVWPAEVAAAAPLAMGGAISTDSGDQTAQDRVFVCFDICFFMLHS